MRQRRSRLLTGTKLSWRGACLIYCIVGIFPVRAITQTPSAKLSSNPEMVITDKDNGAQETVPQGGTVVVRLEVTSGTGYSWAPAKNGAPQLKALGKPSREKPKDSRPGATEIQIFRFKAVSAGSATLEFHYARPWEKNTPPAKTFQVQITVQ